MKQRQPIRKLRQKLDLPADIALHSPITLDIDEVTIQAHEGIEIYEAQQIRVRTKTGSIVVLGEDLEISKMSPMRIVITGRIHAVELERGV